MHMLGDYWGHVVRFNPPDKHRLVGTDYQPCDPVVSGVYRSECNGSDLEFELIFRTLMNCCNLFYKFIIFYFAEKLQGNTCIWSQSSGVCVLMILKICWTFCVLEIGEDLSVQFTQSETQMQTEEQSSR